MEVNIEHMPVSLEHDGLKDAVVSVYYVSDYNVRYISQNILAAINSNNDNPFVEIPTKDKSVANESLSYKDSNDKILMASPIYRILVSEDRVTFNFTKKYPGWNSYSNLINIVLNSIGQVNLRGVYLQYMSCFENTDIFKELDGTIKLNQLPNFNGSVFNFSCNCNKQDEPIAEATIKLTNNKQIQNSSVSIIEVAIAGKKGDYHLEECLQLLSECHKFEKHLFFLLLSEKFINTLNPHYE